MEDTATRTAKCGTGLDQGVSCLLAYLLGWVGGLVFFVAERENAFVRFNAAQSIILSGAACAACALLSVLSWVPFLGTIFFVANVLMCLGVFALTVVLVVMSFQGRKVILPIIGSLAGKWIACT
ncbi:MAG: hypothetical protein PHU25_17675 [Deltaproteobacteria bacterium]|nr:hypothetical protein [Deltaproteobacteria bacterium]